MRERYVLQVLLVTVGFGLLLGVFAVVETPKDWSQPATDAMAKPLEAASRFADFQDECLPFDLTAREAQAPAKQHCEETDPSLRGLRSE